MKTNTWENCIVWEETYKLLSKSQKAFLDDKKIQKIFHNKYIQSKILLLFLFYFRGIHQHEVEPSMHYTSLTKVSPAKASIPQYQSEGDTPQPNSIKGL